MKASKILKEADEQIHIVGHYKNSKGYCALGLLACRNDKKPFNPADLEDNDVWADKILEVYGIDDRPDVRCPACGEVYLLSTIIVQLNDDHNWTFKQIGEWLEQFEDDSS